MINVIKMDCFRFLKGKSGYIILAVLAAICIFSSLLDASRLTMPEQEQMEEEEVNSIKIYEENYDADYSADTDDKASMLSETFSGNIIGMAMIIFAGLFAGGYRKNRFEKNIMGAVGRKYRLVISNATVCMIFPVIVIMAVLSFSVIGYAVFYPAFFQLPFGNVTDFIGFIVAYYFLLVCICIMMSAFVQIIGNQTAAIIVGLIYGSGIVYDIIDFVLKQIYEGFSIRKYLPIGNLYDLSIGAGIDIYLKGIVLALVFSFAALAINIIVKNKQDIVC